ncbi:hypothetical protein ACHAQA_010166 [Verticillium albo-atrum]
MADPLSIASGVIGVLVATAQSTKALYQTVQSFRDQPRAVRQLQDELKSLDGVLDSLHDAIEEDATFFVALGLPLRQCCEVCTEFQALVVNCTTHSDGARPSVRDWVRLRYMDTDIRGFTEMLAGYKATMAVALADANLKSSKITRKALDEYKDMVRSTTEDLETHLEEINAKLRSLAPWGQPLTLTPEDRRWFERERRSTEQCLDICAQGLARLDELRLGTDYNTQAVALAQNYTLAEATTMFALTKCREELALYLRAKEEQTGRYRPMGATNALVDPAQDNTQRLGSESRSTEQCIAVLRRAAEQASSSAVHIVEDVDIGMDGQQLLITSRDQLFEARRVRLGNRAKMVVMSSSSEAVQEFLRSRK